MIPQKVQQLMSSALQKDNRRIIGDNKFPSEEKRN